MYTTNLEPIWCLAVDARALVLLGSPSHVPTNIQIRPPSRCHGGGGGVIHNLQLRHSTTRRASKSRAARIIPTNHHELEEQQTPAPGDRRLLVDSSVARNAIYVSAQQSSTYCALVTEPETFLYTFVRH